MTHLERLLKLVPDLSKAAILDLGCGKGRLALEMKRRGFDVVGIDVNPDYLTMIRDQAEKEGLDINVIQGEAESLPFKSDSFDFINCSEVTEHANDPQKLLTECYRVLRSNGSMYISFHNRFGLYDYHYHLWLINLLPRFISEALLNLVGMNKNNDYSAGRQSLSEMHYYTYSQVIKIIKNNNFSYVDTRALRLEEVFSTVFGGKFFARCLWIFLRNFTSTYHFILKK